MAEKIQHVKNDFILSIYDEVIPLGTKGNVRLVKNNQTGVLYVMKSVDSEDMSVYEVLRNETHPNLPRVYEVLKGENSATIIENYVNGSDLAKVLDERGPIPIKTVVPIASQLCDALTFLHGFNPPIIHRDIKLSNVMVEDDNVKLIDFNVSRVHKGDTQNADTKILGTLGYAAPEQFGFKQSDARTDIYSLGIVMNYLLCGSHPDDELPSDEGFRSIIKKCIDFDPEKRYQNAKHLKQAIEGLHNHDPHRRSGIPIPGYRTLTPWKMTLATVSYLFIVFAMFFGEQRFNDPFLAFADSLAGVLYFFSTIWLYTNFLNVRNRLPLIRSRKIYIKVLGYILYTLLIALFFGSIMLAIEVIQPFI